MTTTEQAAVTFTLRHGTAKATGCDDERPTYFECDTDAATHSIELSNGEHVGSFRFCPPSWELREEFHERVKPL